MGSHAPILGVIHLLLGMPGGHQSTPEGGKESKHPPNHGQPSPSVRASRCIVSTLL